MLHDIDPVFVEDHVTTFLGADQIAVGTQPSWLGANTDIRWLRTASEASVR